MTHTVFTRATAFVAYQQTGGKVRLSARMCNVSPSSIIRWRQTSWWHKDTKVKKTKQETSRRMTSFKNAMDSYFSEPKVCTAKDALRLINSMSSCQASMTTFRRMMHASGITRRRITGKVLGAPKREDVEGFMKSFNQIDQDNLLVSVDESYFSEKITPRYAYCPTGTTKLTLSHTFQTKNGSWKQRSLIQAIASDGTKYHELIDGSVNRSKFAEFVTNMPFPRGSTILLDNCRIHKSIENVFSDKGYNVLFLPPYSPEFQPVEFAFSKIKCKVRSLWPWRAEGLDSAIEHCASLLTKEDIVGYFRHCATNVQQYTPK